jgi:hypothetical protein
MKMMSGNAHLSGQKFATPPPLSLTQMRCCKLSTNRRQIDYLDDRFRENISNIGRIRGGGREDESESMVLIFLDLL